MYDIMSGLDELIDERRYVGNVSITLGYASMIDVASRPRSDDGSCQRLGNQWTRIASFERPRHRPTRVERSVGRRQ